MWSKGNMGGVLGWCFSIDVYTWRPAWIVRSSILVWIWPSLISRVVDMKTVSWPFLFVFICLTPRTAWRFILFDHACLATGDRFCYFCWRVSAYCLYSETPLHVVFVVSRGDAGLRAKDINGQKGTWMTIFAKNNSRKEDGMGWIYWLVRGWWNHGGLNNGSSL